MFNIIQKFSLLQVLGVEGMDAIVRRFYNILTTLQRKPYDILDHRKMVLIFQFLLSLIFLVL